jgi:hypothetical protein
LALAIGTQLALLGIGNNSLLRITSMGKTASPSAVGKELAVTGVKMSVIIGTDLFLKTKIAARGVRWLNAATLAVAVPVTIGAVTSYVIDEDEGLENYFYSIDTLIDPEISQDTKNQMILTSIKTIFDYYSDGGQDKKEGLFEYYS